MPRYLVAVPLFVAATLVACGDGPATQPDAASALRRANTATANHTDLSDPSRKIYGFSAYPGFPWGQQQDKANPTCEDLGLRGIKIDNGGKTNVNGTWPITIVLNNQSLTIGSATVTGDGTTWNWTSTVGIDVVISKGGSEDGGGHIYEYTPDAYADNGLFSGMNPGGNSRQEISHVNFCLDLDLESRLTGDLAATRTFDWNLQKTASAPDPIVVNRGEARDVSYTVTADPGPGVPGNWKISGEVFLTNEFPVPLAFSNVQVMVNGDPADLVFCPSGPGDPPGVHSVPANGQLRCTYSEALPSDAAVNVTFSATPMMPGGSVTPDALGPLAFTPDDYVLINSTATVTDAFNGGAATQIMVSEALTGPFAVTYSRTIPASSACDYRSYSNTAHLTAGSDAADAQATVRAKVIGCIGLAIAVNTSFDRSYSWSIDKSATHSTVTTASGQEAVNVTYNVTVTPVSTDGNYAVNGAVTVTNEAAYDAVISVTGAASCTVNLAPGASAPCAYSLAAVNPAGGAVSASATTEGSTPVTASNPYAFGAPTNTSGMDVVVYDQYDAAAEVTLGSASGVARTFNYTRAFGGTVCGTTTYGNTARFASSSGQTGSDSWSVVHVITNCSTGAGCTLTQGYWKTHSTSGPAAHPDDTWNALPNAQNTIFYLSNQSWLTVFRTSPSGNAYYTLAHQFMAATLNVLNGASAPQSVQDALAAAKTFFENNVPVPPSGKYKGKSATELNAMAALLDQYNNGFGPGHCSENASAP